MKRRSFIAVLLAAVAAHPLAQASSRIPGRVVFPGRMDVAHLRIPLQIMVWPAKDDLVRWKIDVGLLPDTLPPPVPVALDGTFALAGLEPGRYHLEATPVGPSLWLKSAVLDGQDALDTAFVIPASSARSELVVTLSDRHSDVVGSVSGFGPGTTVMVVLFPTDTRIWDAVADLSVWHKPARRIRAVGIDATGAFVVRDVPPGNYFAKAMSTFKPADLSDRAFFEQAARDAMRVVVPDGGNASVRLTITPGTP